MKNDTDHRTRALLHEPVNQQYLMDELTAQKIPSTQKESEVLHLLKNSWKSL